MLLAIITAILAYRKAKETGRSPWPWAIAGAAVFIGTQLIVGLGVGIFLGLGVAFLGWSESVFDTADIPLRIVGVVLAFVASWGLLKFLDRRPVTETGVSGPPPPPTF